MAADRGTVVPTDTADSDNDTSCPSSLGEPGLDAASGDSNEDNCSNSPQLEQTSHSSLTAADCGPSSPSAEAPCPAPFEIPLDSLSGSSSGDSGRDSLRCGPRTGSASPASEDAPPSSDEFSDEGVGFGETDAGVGTAMVQAQSQAVDTTSDPLGHGGSAEDTSLEGDEDEDEAVSFGPPAPLTRPITSNEGNIGDGASSLDDEGVELGPPRPPLIVSSDPRPATANQPAALDRRESDGRKRASPERKSFFARKRNNANGGESFDARSGRMPRDLNTLEPASSEDVSRVSPWWGFGTRGMAMTPRPSADDDEGVSFGAANPPSVPQQSPHAGSQIPSCDDSETISVDVPQPQTHSTDPQPLSTPRLQHVSLDQVLLARPSDAHLADDGVPTLPRSRLLNPMDMTDDETPPEVSMPESMSVDESSHSFGQLPNDLASLIAVPCGSGSSSAAEVEHGQRANREEDAGEEMFSRPTPIPLGDQEDAEFEWEDDTDDEVVPASPSPAAMERIRSLSSARLLRTSGSVRPDHSSLRGGSTYSSPRAVLRRSRGDSGCAEPDDEERGSPQLPPLPRFARDRIVRPDQFFFAPSYFRTSTVASDPSSLLSDRPYTELYNTRRRRASTSAA